MSKLSRIFRTGVTSVFHSTSPATNNQTDNIVAANEGDDIAMAPTCDSPLSRCEEAHKSCLSESSLASSTSLSLVDGHLCDHEPLYGMLAGHEAEVDWTHIRLTSPRGSIPEASETFQRVMQQLDDAEETCGRGQSSGSAAGPTDGKSTSCSGKRERRSSKLVKKSASFSSPASHSSSSSQDSSATAAEGKRRMSVPCMRGGKHVQWADEAGVSDLVSVRLIRPRLAKGDTNEALAAAPSTSILRRWSGRH